MKKLYYLSSLPRSGNTVLASILNQNPKIACTSNSIVTDILKNINSLKIGPTSYNNFPDKKSFDNVLKNVSQNYYKDWKNQNHSPGPNGNLAFVNYPGALQI